MTRFISHFKFSLENQSRQRSPVRKTAPLEIDIRWRLICPSVSMTAFADERLCRKVTPNLERRSLQPNPPRHWTLALFHKLQVNLLEPRLLLRARSVKEKKASVLRPRGRGAIYRKSSTCRMTSSQSQRYLRSPNYGRSHLLRFVPNSSSYNHLPTV
jgi:hypothetical protein